MSDLLEIPFGSRNIGYWGNSYGNQVPVKNKAEIYHFIDEHLCVDNIGISVCTFKNHKPYLLFLPFDFDAPDLKDAWKDAIKLYNYLVMRNYDVHITFSGRKGFHIFLTTEPKWYHKDQIKNVQMLFKDMLGLKTLDRQIFGDIRRLMRVPYTYNMKGGLCKEITQHDGKKLDLDLLLLKRIIDRHETSYEKTDFHKYPCIEKLVKEDDEPRHLIRFTYVILRLADGWNEDDIIDEIQSEFNWIDYNESYCRNQILQIDSRGYVPPSCNTLKESGYCPGSCKYGDIKKGLEEVGIK